jgi:hypothetical protein
MPLRCSNERAGLPTLFRSLSLKTRTSPFAHLEPATALAFLVAILSYAGVIWEAVVRSRYPLPLSGLFSRMEALLAVLLLATLWRGGCREGARTDRRMG